MTHTGIENDRREIRSAYARCRRLARAHYENFPVATLLIPRRVRRHMHALYAFARGVDDLGDEAPGDRLELLDRWEEALRALFERDPAPGGPHWTFAALGETVRECDLSIDPFLRLIEANRRDQHVRRYETFQDLLEYCTYSADPVGRLVLGIFGYHDPELYRCSDTICTALQLTNFWQDVARDLEMDRIYIPLEDMRAYGVGEEDLLQVPAGRPFRDLLRFEVMRTRERFEQGRPLTAMVRGRFRVDLHLFSRGGEAVLDAIEDQDFDVLSRRPVVGRPQKLRLILGAIGAMLVGGRT